MKSRTILRTAKTLLFATTLLATCLSASLVRAQSSAFQGTFTLPNEVHWGQTTLPAGNYLLAVQSVENPAVVSLTDAKSGRSVAMVAISIRDHSSQGSSALLIGTRGTQWVVHSLRLAQLGVVFISDPALAAKSTIGKESRKTSIVPIIVAAK